jgi:D-glycerate 3-kinase
MPAGASSGDTPSRALATRGPAFAAVEAASAIDWSRWERAASSLERLLPEGPGRARRIHQLYVPILLWLARFAALAARRPLVAGIAAPQGAGKTTMVQYLVPLLSDLGLRAAAVSIDDFYLPFAEQEALATAHPGNPYLRYRGYPGTHDLELGAAVLRALRGLGADAQTRVPVYDKSLQGGRGDRLPEDKWRSIQGPLDLVLVEGWMLGFHPLAAGAIHDPSMIEVNERLRAYEEWYRAIDLAVILRAADPRYVLRWRVEAEAAARAAGKPALDDAAIQDYVRRFLPAYELYADTVASGRWAPDRQLVLVLGEDRLPVEAAANP